MGRAVTADTRWISMSVEPRGTTSMTPDCSSAEIRHAELHDSFLRQFVGKIKI
jgi:hypothetical protein